MDKPTDLIQQQFGANADKYATSAVHARGESLARLVELTQPRTDWLMLDVSTGAGHTALTFAPHVKRVIAVDLTPQMLETARKMANGRDITNIEFKPADAHTLPFDDNTFNLITNRIALHHYTDARKAIQEMARVCKEGGLIGFTDNFVPPDKVLAGHINHWEQTRDPSHHWEYPVARLESMFVGAGLEIEHTETLSKEMEFDPWADRMGATPELKIKLRQWLAAAPQGVQEWLSPRHEGEHLFFTLHEVILIARKK
ncbi:methyltransferase domain-containing protein [Anaerolineae bacterium CFX7]|nr:methyltransferase domain-containing protein [Anaerolineae bacterium CFX7]